MSTRSGSWPKRSGRSGRPMQAAGPWLVAESRWSDRRPARRAWLQIQRGGMERPSWLAAPRCVAILGKVMPEKIAQLCEAQQRARDRLVPWPEAAYSSVEADFLAPADRRASLTEFRNVGQGMAADAQAAVPRQRRRQRREVRARLGLTARTPSARSGCRATFRTRGASWTAGGDRAAELPALTAEAVRRRWRSPVTAAHPRMCPNASRSPR